MVRSRYAAGTEVPVDQSKLELKRILKRYDVGSVVDADEESGRSAIMFERNGIWYRFTVDVPPIEAFAHTPNGRYRYEQKDRVNARAAEIRRRWRVLTAAVKIKLELAVADEEALDPKYREEHGSKGDGFQREFLPYMLLTKDETVSEVLNPEALRTFYATGQMPNLIAGPLTVTAEPSFESMLRSIVREAVQEAPA